MRKSINIYVLVIIFLIITPILTQAGVLLKWKFEPGEILINKKKAIEVIITNGQLSRKQIHTAKVTYIPESFYIQKYHITGTYKDYIKFIENQYELLSEYDLNFNLFKNGKMEIPSKYIMPLVRNIPVFPEKEISPGDSWEYPGQNILDFKPIISIPFKARYNFIGFEEKLKKKCVKLLINHTLNFNIGQIEYDYIPSRVLGYVNLLYYFDPEEGKPVYAEDSYDVVMYYPNGFSIEYKTVSTNYFIWKKKKNVNEFSEKLFKMIPDYNEIEKEKTDEGALLRMEDILFDYNSAELKPEAEKKLNSISDALKMTENYEIIIKGYTDNIGSPKFNLELSGKRAYNVLQYLDKKDEFKEGSASYKGLGESNPIAPNDTENGRQKNRRVEILIIPE